MMATPSSRTSYLLLVALFGLCSASPLPTVSRQEAISRLNHPFHLVRGTGCPSSLQHTGSAERSSAGGARCGGADAPVLFRTDVFRAFDKAAAAVPSGFAAGHSLLESVFAGAPGAVLAVQKRAASCGSFKFPKGTISAFVVADHPVEVSRGVKLPKGFWLVMARPGWDGLCTYSTSGRGSRRGGVAGQRHGDSHPDRGSGKHDGGNYGGGEGNHNGGQRHPGDGRGHGNGRYPQGPTVSTGGPRPGVTAQPQVVYYDEVCFPGGASVLLESGERKLMCDVQIGDRVQAGPGVFSTVFMFTHRLPKKRYPFVRLIASNGAALSLTAGHILHVNGGLSPAGRVRVGDVLRNADGDWVRVIKVEAVDDVGLYNPQTVSGDIVVDGLLATAYTAAIRPPVAHAMLAPLRAAFRWVGRSSSTLEDGFPFAVSRGLGEAQC